MASKLPKFDGADVTSATIAVTNAGDGLSKAMKVEPRAFHMGDKVYVVIETEVAKIRHEPVEKDNPTGAQRRVHTLRAGVATVVEHELVADVLEAQKLIIEEHEGVVRLPLGDSDQVEK